MEFMQSYYDGTDNMAKCHSIPCIALYSCNNSTGSSVLLNLQTKQRVQCLHWQKMVTTKLVIKQINALDLEEVMQPEAAVWPTAVEATEVTAAQAYNPLKATVVTPTPEQREVVAEVATE